PATVPATVLATIPATVLATIPATIPATVPPPDGCVDFSGYPQYTSLGNPFSLNGYRFTGLGAEPLVKSGSLSGLMFTEVGLEIDLPGPASAVTLAVVVGISGDPTVDP